MPSKVLHCSIWDSGATASFFKDFAKSEAPTYEIGSSNAIKVAAQGAKAKVFVEGPIKLEMLFFENSVHVEDLNTTSIPVGHICGCSNSVVLLEKVAAALDQPSARVDEPRIVATAKQCSGSGLFGTSRLMSKLFCTARSFSTEADP